MSIDQRSSSARRTTLGIFSNAVWQYWLLLVWCVWWGGLTFYALIVVPIGTEVLGAVEQGFLTQRVTQWHNGLSSVWAAILLVEAIRRPSRWIWAITILLSLVAVLLFLQHARLTAMMDFDSRTVPADFYARHEIYLCLIAMQWVVGLLVPLLFWNAGQFVLLRFQAHGSEKIFNSKNL